MDLDPIDMEGLVGQLIDASLAGSGQWVVTANLDHLRRYQDGSEYADLVRQADVVVADGRPVLWAAQLSGASLPGLVTGSDLVPLLASEAARRGARAVVGLGRRAQAAAQLPDAPCEMP